MRTCHHRHKNIHEDQKNLHQRNVLKKESLLTSKTRKGGVLGKRDVINTSLCKGLTGDSLNRKKGKSAGATPYNTGKNSYENLWLGENRNIVKRSIESMGKIREDSRKETPQNQ